MKVDIISDTICPWCYIGKARLEKAMTERPEIEFEIHWRPFQLNPDMPPGGMGRDEYLEAKFGGPDGARAAYEPVKQAAFDEGLDLRFDMIPKTPNTIDSHRLVRWSKTAGVQGEIVTALFQAYFEDGEDVSDPDILAQIAADNGMDANLVVDLLEGDEDKELISSEDQMARNMGVNGVPAFIFNDRFMVSGAQNSETLVDVIDKIIEAEAEASETIAED